MLRAALAVLCLLNLFRVPALGWHSTANTGVTATLIFMIVFGFLIVLGYIVSSLIVACCKHTYSCTQSQGLLFFVKKGIIATMRGAGWNGEIHGLAEAVQNARQKLIKRCVFVRWCECVLITCVAGSSS